MAIAGLTDKATLRRDGKIRAGIKGENGYPINTDYFPLHDAPQLIPTLGEKPKEIFFTVYFDDINAVAPNDLRWYTKNELMCVGDGNNAAYFGSNELKGLKQSQGFTSEIMPDGKERQIIWNRTRARACAYKSCPEYMSGNQCSEHVRLDMVIPQFGMGSLFTLENTSINGLLNIIGALQKARLGNIHRGGKISGEIFKLYKKEVALKFENAKTGAVSRSDKDVVHMDHVPFETYEKNFKDKCSPNSWQALMGLRQVPYLLLPNSGAITMPAIEDRSSPQVALPPPTVGVAAAAQQTVEEGEAIILARANAPEAAALFEELGKLLGKDNTIDRRVATAKVCADVPKMVAKLNAALQKARKDKKEKDQKEAPLEAAGPAKEPEVLPPVAGAVVAQQQQAAAPAAGAKLW